MMEAVAKALEGNRRALARLITLAECGGPEAEAVLKELHPRGGTGYVVGMTGPPGAGKSTLMACLVRELRRSGDTVCVVAVDPTSPLSGGAVLGDRVRLADLGADPGFYMRSMGSRGHLGGLSEAVGTAVAILDAVGFDWIFVETVGVGQSETEVAHYCDTAVLVCVPGMGDGIQVMKAGILEVADLYAVNKADAEGADRLIMELGFAALPRSGGWTPGIIRTTAVSGLGVKDLLEEIRRHRSWQSEGCRLAQRRRANCRFDLIRRAQRQLFRGADDRAAMNSSLEEVVDQVCSRKLDPVQGSAQLLRHALGHHSQEEQP